MSEYMDSRKNSELVEKLQVALADTFVLYFKTHSFHWNVEGPHFKALHDLFMEQYTELWNITDEIAERIRTLGAYAPNSYKELLGKATLSEISQTPDAMSMAKQLAEDNIAITDTFKAVLKEAEDLGDESTTDLMIGRITVHEKTAWMLRAILKEA